MKWFKRFVMRVWLVIPFGYICKFKYGELTVTLKKNLWLVISDGHSNDALPINLVSQELVDECEKQMMMRGYGA